MRVFLSMCVAVFLYSVTPAYGKGDHYEAIVADPYVELHTGPGEGYPVFHVVDRGDRVEVLKRRTDWYQVRTATGIEGWVMADQMAKTLDPSGAAMKIDAPDAAQYAARTWEAGLVVGEFGGANAISAYGAWHVNRNVAFEVWGSSITGDYSDGWLLDADIALQPFPEWRVSPYVLLGTGVLHVEPQATLAQSPDRTDQVARVGAGVRTYLTKRFLFRAGYDSYRVFTSQDDNKDEDAWTAGFAFFF